MTRREKLFLALFIIAALLFLFSIPVKVAYPKDPPPHFITACRVENRPEMALDGHTGKLVPVGPDRWFVWCAETATIKGKEKFLHPRYLRGDLGGYGYYADYLEAVKAAHDETRPKTEVGQ